MSSRHAQRATLLDLALRKHHTSGLTNCCSKPTQTTNRMTATWNKTPVYSDNIPYQGQGKHPYERDVVRVYKAVEESRDGCDWSGPQSTDQR
jgi:hypothetical protein